MLWALTVSMLVLGAPDAGVRTASVTLGGTVADVQGETWPTDARGPLSMHEFKGPLRLTVKLPGGREYVSVTRTASVLLASDLKTVSAVLIDGGTAPTWPAIVERSQQPLMDLGVTEERRRTWKTKLLAKPVPFPSHPVEECVVVTTTMREKPGVGFYLYVELTTVSPPLWRARKLPPDLCQ